MAITDKDWNPEHSYGITRKRAIELREDVEYPRISAAVFHFDKLTPEEQVIVIGHKEKELKDALEERKQIYRSAKESAVISRKLNLRPGEMSPYPRQKKQVKERIEMLQKSVDRLKSSVKVSKPANNTTSGLAVKKVKGGYEVIHTKSGNRLMPFSYPERELATDFARRAGRVGVDWTRPFPELQKESEKIADLIRGGRKPGMFEKVLDMPTTFPKTPSRKPLKDMTKAELKNLRVILHVLPDGTLEIKEKGTDSLERQVASWNPPNRPDMTERSWVGGYISGERVADDAKSWLDKVAKRYDLDTDEIVSDSWRGGGMRHKASPYSLLTNIVTGKVKTVSGSDTVIDKATDLQAIHDARSQRSRESDERQSNADTIEPDDPRVERWLRDPGRVDVVGIDTPRKGKSQKPVRKSKRTGKIETQVRGVRR